VRTLAFVALAFTAAAQSPTPPPLPEGEGKKTVEKICLDCHGPETFTGLRLTKEGWDKVVNDMVEKGAQGSEAELDQIVMYLTKNFGKDRPKR
jgi:competence protein ComEA